MQAGRFAWRAGPGAPSGRALLLHLHIGRWRFARLGLPSVFMEFGRKLGGTVRCAVSGLLLLLIAFHASVPGAAPLERGRGSAFSAATADVSVLRGRITAGAQRVAGLIPVSGAVMISLHAALPTMLRGDNAMAQRHEGQPRAPPLPGSDAALHGARAPPAA